MSGLRSTRRGTMFSPWALNVTECVKASQDMDLSLLFTNVATKAAAAAQSGEYIDDVEVLHRVEDVASAHSGELSEASRNQRSAQGLPLNHTKMSLGGAQPIFPLTMPGPSPHVGEFTRSTSSQMPAPPNNELSSDLSSLPGNRNRSSVGASTVHAGPPSSRPAASTPREPSEKTRGSVEKRRSKGRSSDRRRAERLREAERAGSNSRIAKKVAQKHIARAEPMTAKIHVGTPQASHHAAENSIADVPRSSTAFVGRRPTARTRKNSESLDRDSVPLSKEEMMTRDFRYVKWDGVTTTPLLDSEDRVFAVLVGRPNAEDWPEVERDIQAALNEAREGLRGSAPDAIPPLHRRGIFVPLASGISYGGGQKVPCNGSVSEATQSIIDGLLANRSIKRVAGFGDAAFKTYAPRLHQYYHETLSALLDKDPRLRPNFPNSVFGSITFNLGPQTVTHRHTDFQNLPAGWCAVTAIGDFDPVESGHIILWEAKLIVEFPPGSTILIPSAIIHHSNTTIRSHESRYSITQYSAGGLFRWVECGFMSQKEFDARGKKHPISGDERWLRGLGMFSTWSELSGNLV